jgi:hypothetical protein
MPAGIANFLLPAGWFREQLPTTASHRAAGGSRQHFVLLRVLEGELGRVGTFELENAEALDGTESKRDELRRQRE